MEVDLLVFGTLLILREDGQPIGYKRVWKDLIKACKRAGVDYAASHAGRHTHATELLADGVPAAAVAERLGHATRRIETEIDIEKLVASADEGRDQQS